MTGGQRNHPGNGAHLRARLIGTSEISVDDRLLTGRDWPGRKARSLFLVLLASPGHQLHREEVLDLLWPELDPDAGANALSKALHAVRRTLEPDLRAAKRSRFIASKGQVIGLAPGVALRLDLDEFAHLLDRAGSGPPSGQRQVLRDALSLYRGEFVADERYADWPIGRREALRAEFERATILLARLDLEAGEPLASVPHLESLLAFEPTAEAVHRELMRAYHAGGQRNLAMRQFERCREVIRRELDDDPEPETLALATAIREAADPAAASSSRLAAASRRSAMPTLPNPTVGRETEIAALRGLLADPATRLVTITGTGGVGKTRVAVEVATGLAATFPDGVAFVSLSAIRDPDFMFSAIAAALRLPDDARSSAAGIVTSYLQPRRFMLVLDNLEQLTAAGKPLAGLLEACPGLAILATSRVPLRIRAEQLCKLDVLALPAPGDASGESLGQAPSAALFLQLLRAQQVGFLPTADDARAIVALCIRLDGLPLAIELAAARCYDQSPADVLARIEQRARITVLHDGPQDLPDRHQTLRDLVLWSYDLLSTPEQAVFRRLAVFAGGVEEDALVAVCGEDALAHANVLADHSLVQWTHVDGVRRLTMLETIREVAAELLAAAGEEHAAWVATAAFHAGLSTMAHDELKGPDQLRWYDRLARDLNTIRATLDWALVNAPGDALAIAGHLNHFWYYRHNALEGARWIEQALAVTPDLPSTNRMIAAMGMAQCLERTGDYDRSREFVDWALDAADELHHEAGRSAALLLRAGHEFRDDNYDRAEENVTAALAISRARTDAHGIGHSLVGLSLCHKSRVDYGGAIQCLEEALVTARQAGHRMLESYVLMHLANTLLQSGDLARAAGIARECEHSARIADSRLALPWSLVLQMLAAHSEGRYAEGLLLARDAASQFSEVGDRRAAAATIIQCGMLETCLGEHSQAAASFLAAIPDVRGLGYESDKYDYLMETALLAQATGHHEASLTLLAANVAGRAVSGPRRSDGDASRAAAAVDAVRLLLDKGVADSAWSRGESMNMDEALDLAVACCHAVVAGNSQAVLEEEVA